MGNYNKKQTRAEILETQVFGKMQPQAIPLEEAVLGALMLDREALGIVDTILSPETFYLSAHQHIYRAITGLAERSLPVDLLTVTDELRRLGKLDEIGGGYYLIELSNRVASAANIEYHAFILKQKYLQRRIIEVSGQATASAYDDTVDVFEQLDTLEKNVFSIASGAFQKSASSIGSVAVDVLKVADTAMSQKGLTGVPGGLKAVDAQTGGWQNTDLIIIAGRPGMGKTAFAIANGINAATNYGMPVMLYSMEMSSLQIVQRVVAQLAKVNIQALRNGKLTERDFIDLKAKAESLHNIPFHIDDTPALTISTLRSKARKAVLSLGVKMIIVDYLQLMSAGKSESFGANREQQIGEISRGLKALAKELNVPIIALSQLSRAVETRGGSKRPQLSDLRESGNLEQDADAVVFLYRPEYYGITEDENGQSLKGKAEVIFAKHRNGAVGTCDPIGFIDTTAEFYNLEDVFSEPTPGPSNQFPTHTKPEPDPIPNILNQARPKADDDIPF